MVLVVVAGRPEIAVAFGAAVVRGLAVEPDQQVLGHAHRRARELARLDLDPGDALPARLLAQRLRRLEIERAGLLRDDHAVDVARRGERYRAVAPILEDVPGVA